MSAQSTESKKGCSGVIVFMVAVFCLVIGLIVGAGGLYGYLSAVEDGVTNLGLAAPQAVAVPTPAVAEKVAAEKEEMVYALVYPIEETLRIEGGIDQAAVRNLVSRERFKFQECYNAELEKKPSIKGEISLQFTVAGSNGQVVAAVTRQNTTNSTDLANCVLKEVRTWKFQPIKDGQLSVVRFDALFLPISGAQAMP
ncbi:MAG: AgmX/PglI C-terminal domain-containing protein [Bradymonadaceae bacterium]